MLTPRPSPKLKDRAVLAVRHYLCNIIPATLHIAGRSSICKLRRCLSWWQWSTDSGVNYTCDWIVWNITALIPKELNCRCQVWRIPKFNADKLKYSQCTGRCKGHSMAPISILNYSKSQHAHNHTLANFAFSTLYNLPSDTLVIFKVEADKIYRP
jgi:hypothetical protein